MPRTRGGVVVSWEQLRAAGVIVRECARYPWPSHLRPGIGALTIAALTNAWAESRWDPTVQSGFRDAAGRREDSWGLFQLNRAGGVGTGFSVASLQDPHINTQLILGEVVRQDAATGAIHRALTGTVGDVVATFCAEVERPADRHREGERRRQLAATMWGADLVRYPALSL